MEKKVIFAVFIFSPEDIERFRQEMIRQQRQESLKKADDKKAVDTTKEGTTSKQMVDFDIDDVAR